MLSHAFLIEVPATPLPVALSFFTNELQPHLRPGALGFLLCHPKDQPPLSIGARLAGLTVKDTMVWLTEDQPAHAILLQKDLDEIYAHNALTHGCGGLNIDACRIFGSVAPAARARPDRPTTNGPQRGAFDGKPVNSVGSPLGRFPANVLLNTEAKARLDAQTGGEVKGGKARVIGHTRSPSVATPLASNLGKSSATLYGDKGGASRFFRHCPTPDDWYKYLATMLWVPGKGRILVSKGLVPPTIKAGWHSSQVINTPTLN